ncbi:MAG: 50S ribosomal protein L15e [Candidatus Micrarchaeota archaeon]|nr:MAG: 50S ribosomal protein L15e [Candidatus Micrarchaeota archaeon]
MSMYKYIQETFQNEYKERSQEYKERLARWADEPVVKRIDKPTNIARARKLGYKDKQGVIVVRVRVDGGKTKRERFDGGRKPSKSGRFYSRHKSLRMIAEERANREYRNCEVVNSYFVGSRSNTKYYEVILVDRNHPAIINDKFYSQIIRRKGRAFRGLTSAGRKVRGLLA